MKTRALIVVCLISIVAVASAYGASGKVMGRVTVPQAFEVNGKQLPAGSYEFTSLAADSNHLVLRNRDTGARINLVVVERLAQSGSPNAPGRVVFNSVGGRRTLSEFWPSGNGEGYLLEITKKEHKHETLKAE